ncbi:hypothetical protein T459_15942 [Capsicum annuum]|uniref:Plant PDR ABC transporter associated domain-containing protein n=1 Tax=Capsicum annuum TaxID=4072 RepID=A0A2G2Z7A8_CAPAN|nr:hypothetical protein T459_15942 [Capsicum annuum]
MKTLPSLSLSPGMRPIKCVSVSSAIGGGGDGESELSLSRNPERWGDESRGDGVPDDNLEVPISVGGLKPNNETRFSKPIVDKVLVKERSMYTEDHVFWLCVVAQFAFSFLFNFFFILALTYLNPLGNSRSVISDDGKSKKKKQTQWSSASSAPMTEGIVMDARNTNNSSIEKSKPTGMALSF